jgi:inosine-uridine nucleoside N-ribohydrolase
MTDRKRGTFRGSSGFTAMTRPANHRRLIALAVVMAGVAVTFAQANAASETTRRNSTTIQNYQSQQGQTPYYSGQSNPYYGNNPQTPQQPQPNATNSNALQNQLRDNTRRNGR